MHTIDLIRHPESQWMVEARSLPEPLFGGRMDDVDLSDTCVQQGKNLGRYARDNHITPLEVFCSPALRARRGHELSAPEMGIGDMEPIIDDRLQERDWGDWVRKPRSLLDKPPYKQQREELGDKFVPPGGESIAKVRAHMADFLMSLVTDYPEGHYWAHTHRGPIKTVVGPLLGWTPEQTSENDLAVVSLTRLGVDPNGQPILEFFNRPTYTEVA